MADHSAGPRTGEWRDGSVELKLVGGKSTAIVTSKPTAAPDPKEADGNSASDGPAAKEDIIAAEPASPPSETLPVALSSISAAELEAALAASRAPPNERRILMTHNILTAIAILVAASGGVFAQIRVQDNVAIGIANDTKAMTDQIMQDTAKILVNTTRTLEAITGDRSADANQFASAALARVFHGASAGSCFARAIRREHVRRLVW